MRLHSNTRIPAKRFGSATVEFAIVGPLIFMLIFGMLELGRQIMAKESLTDSARKAARTAAYPGQTSTNAISDARDILKDNFGSTVANSTNTVIQVKVAQQSTNSSSMSGSVWTSAPTIWVDMSSVTPVEGDIIWAKVSVRVDEVAWLNRISFGGVWGWFTTRSASDIESENVYMLRQN
jgi:Flp pilus assembly protein TadG